MSNLFHTIKQDKAPEIIKVLVEIPRGDFVKYEYNHEYGVLEVDRVCFCSFFDLAFFQFCGHLLKKLQHFGFPLLLV